MDSHEFLRRMPKVELHCHFEGSVTARTFLELAAKNGVAHDISDPAEAFRAVTDHDEFMDTSGSLPTWVFATLSRLRAREPEEFFLMAMYEAFLERFGLVCEAIVDVEDFSRCAYESLVLAADRSNIRYREMFFHPQNHPGVAYRTMVDGMLDGIRAAEADRGIVCRLIPSINRDFSAAAGNALVDDVLAYRKDEVIGIASEYDEEHLAAFAEPHARARRAGLRCTAHVGQLSSPRAVAECIDLLGCRRIDHGYAVADDPALVERARELGVHFAGQLSASAVLHDPVTWSRDGKLPDYAGTGFARMIEAGLSVSINSDDPEFGHDLTSEYVQVAEALGFSDAKMTELAFNAVDAAWLDDSDKESLRRELRAETEEREAAR
jgi:adenosine deaminase